MPSIRQIASKARTQTRVALYGNNHSFRVNMRYAAYEGEAKRRWKAPIDPFSDRPEHIGYHH